MTDVNDWTGKTACALQASLRMSNETFARHLGIAVRTVASWHQKPELTPKPEMQQLLDTTLERATELAKDRFANLVGTDTPALATAADTAGTAEVLRVAVAVVVRGEQVLVVCRRDDAGPGSAWQFPAGVVKPGGSAATVAVRETLAETGVHCTVRREIGSRLHPITDVHCDYLLCDYLTGDAENIDVAENVSVVWADIVQLTRFIPADRIYPPILEALEVPG